MNLESVDKKFVLPKSIDLKNDFTPPTYDEWKKVVEKDLKGLPFEKLITKILAETFYRFFNGAII